MLVARYGNNGGGPQALGTQFPRRTRRLVATREYPERGGAAAAHLRRLRAQLQQTLVHHRNLRVGLTAWILAHPRAA